jgi:hypothetical protein
VVRRLVRQFAVALAVVSLFAVGTAHADGVEMRHLPAWVQIVVASEQLYRSDTSSSTVGGKLPRYTYLHVLGGGSQRLLVEPVGESGQPGQQGWIDPDTVQPSTSALDWLVTNAAATLYGGPDPGAAPLRQLQAFVPLQQLDGPLQGRVEVVVYRADMLAILNQGWIDESSTGPALAPQTRVPDPEATPSRSAPTDQWAFVNDVSSAAIVASTSTGVPASVTVAQAILESDWGRSALSQSANNYFGIKAVGGLGNDGVVWLPTGEFDAQGQSYETTSAFRAYRSLDDSFADHDRMLSTSSRYQAAMQAASDARQFAEDLESAGYATDPDYASKLIALMDRYDLYQLDHIA